MAVERNAACPCGSGKKYKQCCAVRTRSQRSKAVWIFATVAAAVVAGALFLAFGPSQTGGTVNEPTPWFYDARQDRHWHPEHAHWHEGPPPRDAPVAQDEPAPWQYEPASDRHWDPERGEWRPGNPRPEPEPEAWSYDAANDRHWNPQAKQWRAGPPVSEE